MQLEPLLVGRLFSTTRQIQKVKGPFKLL